MSGNVIKLYPPDACKDPDHILEMASGAYKELLVIGWNHDGELEARANSTLDAGDLNWLIDVFKQRLVAGDYSE